MAGQSTTRDFLKLDGVAAVRKTEETRVHVLLLWESQRQVNNETSLIHTELFIFISRLIKTGTQNQNSLKLYICTA